MVIVSINALPYGSTGNIMMQISDVARKKGHTAYTFAKPIPNYQICEEWKRYHYEIGTAKGVRKHARLAAYTGFDGIYSRHATLELIKKLDEIKPDIIHLHNLHGWFINYGMLFKYIKKYKIRTIWTLHDCWSFTGHCPYFTLIGCNKWETGCYRCPQYKDYPHCKIDHSKAMWRFKKKWFTGVQDLTVVTPSQWLADLANKSFLREYPIKVINNGIDLTVFKPTESDFRQKYQCADDFILLGVASDWGKRKGLDVFNRLAEKLPENYQIVLVGVNSKENLSDRITRIPFANAEELAQFYSVADVFVNPTREDNYPTVNLESIACGTPVVTFRTGGSTEIVESLRYGEVVEADDLEALLTAIINTCQNNYPFPSKKMIATLDKNEKFQDYCALYEDFKG